MSATPRPRRLAVLVTHPVQYFGPVFAALAKDSGIELLVFFGCDHGVRQSLDPDFGVPFAWDSAPTEGFNHVFLSHGPLADLSRWSKALPLALRARRCVQEFCPDGVLVFAYTPAWVTTSTLLLRLMGQRLYLRADGTDRAFPRSRLKSAVKDMVLRLWYRQFSHVFPIGIDSDQHFARLGVPQPRRHPVPYAVDVAFFADQVSCWLPRRHQLRVQQSIPPQALVLLWSAKMTPVKHPQVLLEALALLPSAVRERFWLLAVGDGPLRDAFEREASALLPARSRFVGFRNQSELGACYTMADALVFPSRLGETWGLVVNEALQFGLAVIASDHAGCVRDLIAPPATTPSGSAVFPSEDPVALAQALEYFAELHPEGFRPQPIQSLPHPSHLAQAVAQVLNAEVNA